MQLENITLLNFKNYAEQTLNFAPGVNALVGPNGSGKTNLLDAIYYLSLTKSALNPADAQNIRHGQPYFGVKGTFMKGGNSYAVQVSLKLGQKKVITCNKQEYDRLSDHIGAFPLVLMTPYDTDIIREGSETRRKFFDGLLSQAKPGYLQGLQRYNAVLRQRNALLKQFAERGQFNQALLEPYNHQMVQYGEPIHAARQELMAEFVPHFLRHYEALSEGREPVAIHYQSPLQDQDFAALLVQQLTRDMAAQRTLSGVHKDDYIFEIVAHPLKRFGSQGQQKSFVIALKLAQFDLMHQHLGMKPLLLLDDIFDKLDDRRIARLLDLVASEAFSQIFLTDARPERTRQLFAQIDVSPRLFSVAQGTAKPAGERLAEG